MERGCPTVQHGRPLHSRHCFGNTETTLSGEQELIKFAAIVGEEII